MPEIVLQLLNGLFVGMSLALVAAGLALVFGVLRIVNFAQGELFMLGAYTVVYVSQLTGDFWLGVLAATVGVGTLGGGLLFILLWPLTRDLSRDRSPVLPLLVTLALSLMLRQAAGSFFGGFIRTVNQPISLALPVEGLQYPVYDLVIAAVSGLALVATHQFLKYSRPGIWLRAVADNAPMAASLGVPLPRVYLVAFIVSAGLSGLAGAMLAPVTAVYAGLGQDVAFNAFVVIVAGGLGTFSVRRAAAFALVLGELQALGSIWFRPVAVQVFSIAVVVAALAVRARARPLSPTWRLPGLGPSSIGWRGAVLLLLVLLLGGLLPLAQGPAASQRATPILVSLLVATAVATLLRFGSVLNLGMGAVFGASAYAAALFSAQVAPIWVLVLALLAAALVSALYAAYAGVASGVEYMMLTFMTTAAAAKLPNLFPALAGGANGLGVRDVRSVAFGIDPLDGAGFYILALCMTAMVLVVGWLLLSSQLGRLAEAAGRNPLRTASMGYGLGSLRLFVAVLAGGFAGVAGWIYAVESRVVGQAVLGLDTSLDDLIYALGLLIVVYALPRGMLGLFTRNRRKNCTSGR